MFCVSENKLKGNGMKDLVKVLSGIIATFAVTSNLYALGTTAGVNITNTATVNFSVGGAAQPSVDSNTTDFEVDQLVVFTVTSDGNENVIPSGTGEVLTFTLNHTGNYAGDFGLTVSNEAGDDFDPASTAIFVEDGTTPGYQVGEDTETFVDELAADGSIKVHVVSTMPGGIVNTNVATVNLIATAKAGGVASTQGADLVQTVGADGILVIDNVFNDAIGSDSGDVARDGKHSDSGDYIVLTATLAVVKSSAVISDPVNSTTNPKRIPGAVIEYTIAITNSGGAAADNLTITDTIDSNTTFVAASILVDGNAEDDDAIGADETDPDGATYNGSNLVTATIGTIAGSGGSKNVVFRVTVD